MAHNDNGIMEATLRALVEQQAEILKCVQSWQTGQGYSIGDCLGRLDKKMDLLVASGPCTFGAAQGEVRSSVRSSDPSDSFTSRCHPENFVQDDMKLIAPLSDIAGDAFQPQISPQTETSAELEPASPSKWFDLPHTVSEAGVSHPVPRSSPTYTRGVTHASGTARRKSIGKYIIEKKKRDVMAQQPRLVRVTSSAYFEVLCSTMIILNVLCICWQTQLTASSVEEAFVSGAVYSDSVPATFVAIQSFFTAFFVLEVGIRWAAVGFTQFVCSGDWMWNAFDIGIVSAGLLQQFLQYLQRDAGLGSIFAVRCLRILRLLRVFRTLRYFVLFRELRMLINTCLGGLKAYIWCCCINALVVLFFGITLTTRTYTYIMTSEQYADDAGARLLQGFFGTLDKSMLSLVQAASGGRDWYELYDILRMVGAADSLLLLCFLSFSIYVLANAAAAVFVEGAMAHAKHDTELVIKQQLDRDSESRKKLLDVFEEMDYDGNGTLTLEEFTSHLEDDRVRAYFDAFQLDVGYAPQIFSLLDMDGSGQVDIHEFIDGCIKLKGEARQLKLCEIQHAVSSINESLRKINRSFERWPLPKAGSMLGGHQASSTGRAWPGLEVPMLAPQWAAHTAEDESRSSLATSPC